MYQAGEKENLLSKTKADDKAKAKRQATKSTPNSCTWLDTLVYSVEIIVIALLFLILWKYKLPRIPWPVVLGVFFFLVFFHRILGWFVGFVMRMALDKKWRGAFNIHFDWIGFRFGLDQNQICVYGLEWRNPPFFVNTPFLLRIDEITIMIDPMSILHAIFRGKAIRIPEIKIDHVVLHVEKATEKEVILASQSGWLKSPDQLKIEAMIADRQHDDALRAKIRVLKSNNATPEDIKKLEDQIVAPLQIEDQIHVGMTNLFAALGATKPENETSIYEMIVKRMDNACGGHDSVLNHLGSAVCGGGRPDSQDAVRETAMQDDDFQDCEDEEDEGSCPCLCGKDGPTQVDAAGVKTTKGFGFPYKIWIDELYLARVEVNAQDFLNATHTKENEVAAIRITLLKMFRTELSKVDPSGGRSSLYLDDIVFRILNKLIAILLYENSVSFMALIAGAMVNRSFVAAEHIVDDIEHGFEHLAGFFTGKNPHPKDVKAIENKIPPATESFFFQTTTAPASSASIEQDERFSQDPPPPSPTNKREGITEFFQKTFGSEKKE